MSDISRRDVLRRLALTLTAAGVVDRVAAQEVHLLAWQSAAGAAAWIDMLASENAQLKQTYTTGLAWLDAAMKSRGAADFVSATPAQQTAMLDLIAYRRNQSAELASGIEFFTWARRMTVDAFYTSEIGIRDIDYQGNRPMMAYPAPTEAIAYALKKSGL